MNRKRGKREEGGLVGKGYGWEKGEERMSKGLRAGEEGGVVFKSNWYEN